MIDRLAYDEKNPARPRRQLDQACGVADWRVPGATRPRRVDGSVAPAWWRGDEEASQSFLQAMNVVVPGG